MADREPTTAATDTDEALYYGLREADAARDAACVLPWSTNEAKDNARAEAERRERTLMIQYPFPCTDNMIALLRLPKYIAQADADRIKRVIDTLVIA